MAYTRKELTTEINEVIQEKLASGDPVVVAWLVQAVLKTHGEKGLSDFSKCARFEFVNDEVGRCVRRFKEPEPDELEQLVLPGFARLQKAYRLLRGGQQIIVPIEAMTDAEIEAKATEHESMAAGHRLHARELRRYLRNRTTARGTGT